MLSHWHCSDDSMTRAEWLVAAAAAGCFQPALPCPGATHTCFAYYTTSSPMMQPIRPAPVTALAHAPATRCLFFLFGMVTTGFQKNTGKRRVARVVNSDAFLVNYKTISCHCLGFLSLGGETLHGPGT